MSRKIDRDKGAQAMKFDILFAVYYIRQPSEGLSPKVSRRLFVAILLQSTIMETFKLAIVPSFKPGNK